MPSSRRSQKLPLEDSLIPSTTSSRSKKPSVKADAASKAKADAARKAKADAAARTIIDAAIKANTVKANTAGAAAKANCLRNFKGHIIDNFKAAKKAREAHAVELQRRADAAERVKGSSTYRTSLDLNRIEIYATRFQFSFQRFNISLKYIITGSSDIHRK